jgi:hypothetical protein
MTLSQGYKMAQAARHKKQPCLEYPYLGIPDEDEEDNLSEIQH